MMVSIPRFPLVTASFSAALAMLALACTAAFTPSPPLSRETAATIQTSSPTPSPPLPDLSAASPEPDLKPTSGPTIEPTDKPIVKPTLGIDRVFLRLTDPLDEPEYYCMDVPGAGPGVRLQSPLQAHTCKPLATAADELFTINHPNAGQIYMKAYDLCVEAEGARAGSLLRLKPCSNSQHQLFTLENDSIRLTNSGQDPLCVAVAPGTGIPTGGPSHLRRDLTLEGCESTDPSLIVWSIVSTQR